MYTENEMSLYMRTPTICVPTMYDTNQAGQAQKMARSLKFYIQKGGIVLSE